MAQRPGIEFFRTSHLTGEQKVVVFVSASKYMKLCMEINGPMHVLS